MSSFLILNRFYILICCFHCWLWTFKCRLSQWFQFQMLDLDLFSFRRNLLTRFFNQIILIIILLEIVFFNKINITEYSNNNSVCWKHAFSLFIFTNVVFLYFAQNYSQRLRREWNNNLWSFFEIINLNPFSTNVPLLYSLKTSENLRFSDVFRGYRSGKLVENGSI